MRYILVLTMLVGVGLALTGENIADPIVIHYLPYNTQYTTVGFANDYSLDPSDCTGHTTLGPDVVYSYTPSEDECVVMGVAIPVEVWDVSFFVLTVDGGSPSCYTGSDIMGAGGAEILENVTLIGGNTYYFVIDGRNASDMGEYCFGITECEYNDAFESTSHGRLSLSVSPSVMNYGGNIEFTLPRTTYISLQVYNSAGQLVNTLRAGTAGAGQYTINWEGKDRAGRRLPGGMYFVKLQAGSQIKVAKVLLVD